MNGIKKIVRANEIFLRQLYSKQKNFVVVTILQAIVLIPVKYIALVAPKMFVESVFEKSALLIGIGWIVGLAFVNVFSSIWTVCVENYKKKIISNIVIQTKEELYRNINSIELSYFDVPENHNKMARALAYCETGGPALIEMISMFIEYILTFATITYVSLQFPVWVWVLIVSAFFIQFIITKHIKKKTFEFIKERTKRSRLVGYFSSLLGDKNQLAEMRINNSNEFFINKFRKTTKDDLDLNLKHDKKIGSYHLFQTLPEYLLQIIIYLYLGFSVIKKGLSYSDYTLFFTMYNQINQVLAGLVSCTSVIIEQSKNAEFSIDFIDDLKKYTEIDDGMQDIHIKNIEKIEFRNVSYIYPGQETAALKNVSFTITHGEKIALIGYNGAGKTTLIMLLLLLYNKEL